MVMETMQLEVDRTEARRLYRAYKEHVHWSAPIDREIQRTYQLIAQGRVVIKALESIKTAGLNEQGLPKLAIIRADAKQCFFAGMSDGSCTFRPNNGWSSRRSQRDIDLPRDSFVFKENYPRAKAIVPLVPVHLRPKRGIENYHILWEADWQAVPVDPMLLRRIGKGDLWAVVAAWDLTVIEQAALAGRVRA
jgi:hypothetical protein